MLTIGQQCLLYSGFKALDIQNTLNDRSALFVFLHKKNDDTSFLDIHNCTSTIVLNIQRRCMLAIPAIIS